MDLEVEINCLRFGNLAGDDANKPEKNRLIEYDQKNKDAEEGA
jgi:hypothetical protein